MHKKTQYYPPACQALTLRASVSVMTGSSADSLNPKFNNPFSSEESWN